MLSPLIGDQMSRNHLKKQWKDSRDVYNFFPREPSSSEGMGGYNTDLIDCNPSKKPSSFPHCSGCLRNNSMSPFLLPTVLLMKSKWYKTQGFSSSALKAPGSRRLDNKFSDTKFGSPF